MSAWRKRSLHAGRLRFLDVYKRQVLELAGAEPEEYVLPPLVCLEQYRAEYAGELSLAAAILKELQGDELVRRYADEKAGIYTFQLTK